MHYGHEIVLLLCKESFNSILMCPAHLDLTLINTNNLLPTDKRIKRLVLPPAVLHTPVLVRLFRADLAQRKPAILASVYGAHSNLLSRAERAAHVAAVRDAAARADVACGEAWEARHAGDAADVPDFELLVPFCGGGAGEEDGQDGEEGEESDFELHFVVLLLFGCFETLEDLLLGDFVFAEEMCAGGRAVDMIFYLFERAVDNGLKMLESFGSKKGGRVASSGDGNKGSCGPRIVVGAVTCQSC